MKYSVVQNNAIINIVARFQLQKRVYDIVLFLVFTDTARVLKSSILFEIKRENVIYLFSRIVTVYWNFILCFENTKRQ